MCKKEYSEIQIATKPSELEERSNRFLGKWPFHVNWPVLKFTPVGFERVSRGFEVLVAG